VAEVRGICGDIGGDDDLPLVDGQLRVVACSGGWPCVRITRESWSVVLMAPVGTITGSWGLTMPGAIRRDPSAATPRARHAS
jgi:hypothetical protein